jgi:hypothetical protein
MDAGLFDAARFPMTKSSVRCEPELRLPPRLKIHFIPRSNREATRAFNAPSTHSEEWEGGPMLWTVFAILFILWLLGFSLHVAGSLIHLLLVAALVVLIVNLISGRRTVV